MLIFVGAKAIDSDVFRALNSNSVVFDGKLIVRPTPPHPPAVPTDGVPATEWPTFSLSFACAAGATGGAAALHL